jgi:hypothetical protein
MWLPFFLLCLSVLQFGCSTRSPREQLIERQAQARPRPAAYSMDGFYRDQSFPDTNKPRPSDFFYKRCNLSGRHPYPSSNDWECSEPQ